MTTEELIAHCESSLAEHGHIVLDDDVLQSLSQYHVELLQNRYGTHELLRLPSYEIAFFDWLRSEDAEVWNDLWAGDTRAPYLVSFAYLPAFTGSRRGTFDIRDLKSVDNYYFAPDMLVDKESAVYLAAVRDRFAGGQPLSAAQLLALEASTGPVDIWHLAYRYKLPVLTMKLAVRQLVDDHILVHVPSAEHLAAIFNVR